jgi:hypothetical protein
MTLQVEIKCDCGTRNETPGLIPTLAFFNPCEDCGKKNELKYVGTPSLGGTK